MINKDLTLFEHHQSSFALVQGTQGKKLIEGPNLRNFYFQMFFYDDKIGHLHKIIPKVDKLLQKIKPAAGINEKSNGRYSYRRATMGSSLEAL
ncbi:MAG TPA: hypothetical protein PLZ45_07815 [Ferruginibacter sp.]|nr:hypothetical protein [Ferruginibacter sp.]